MLILGLDPGLRHTGWGVVEAQDNRLRFVACGAVHSNAADDLATRLGGLYSGLAGVIDGHLPREAAVEETVVNRNPLSSLKLGHARGVVLLAAAHAGLRSAGRRAPEARAQHEGRSQHEQGQGSDRCRSTAARVRGAAHPHQRRRTLTAPHRGVNSRDPPRGELGMAWRERGTPM